MQHTQLHVLQVGPPSSRGRLAHCHSSSERYHEYLLLSTFPENPRGRHQPPKYLMYFAKLIDEEKMRHGNLGRKTLLLDSQLARDEVADMTIDDVKD